MVVDGLIVEQLEWDGQLKSFTFNAHPELGDMWIAFPDEYQENRNAPFHFLDSEYERLFERKRTECRITQLTKNKYFRDDDSLYNFIATWNHIQNGGNRRYMFMYYSLYLPEFAVPYDINVSETFDPKIEFRKCIYRDDNVNKYIIYIRFEIERNKVNFKLTAKFYEDRKTFKDTKYKDHTTLEFFEKPADDNWKMEFEGNEKTSSIIFLLKK